MIMGSYKCIKITSINDRLTLDSIYRVKITRESIEFIDDAGNLRRWDIRFFAKQFMLVEDGPLSNAHGLCPPTPTIEEVMAQGEAHGRSAEQAHASSVAQQRKLTPVYSGVLKYFPLALQAVAQCSKAGNDQHNPGEPLHWAREKSGDELDALTRHLLDAGKIDTDGVRHSTKVAWRALANLEKELEAYNAES